MAGTVQQLAMHTEGSFATEAHALMVIAPDSASVSAEVTPDNIGFVSRGQGVAIKLETFTFTRYDMVNANVEKRSRRTQSMTKSAGRSSRSR